MTAETLPGQEPLPDLGRPSSRRRLRRVLMAGVLACFALTGCARGSSAATAQFTIFRYSVEGELTATFEGKGDFAKGETTYSLLNPSGEPRTERREFGSVSYARDGAVWLKTEDSPEGAALRSLTHRLAASTQSLEYLRSVAEDVTEVGIEEVRGVSTVHHQGSVRLTELGAAPEFERFPVEVWVDEDGRTRRFSYHPIGSQETSVWEFYDFGVPVELTPPPVDQVR